MSRWTEQPQDLGWPRSTDLGRSPHGGPPPSRRLHGEASGGHGCLAAVVGLVLGLLAAMVPGMVRAQGMAPSSSDDPMASALRVNVYICVSPTASITPWRQTISRAIARAISSPRGVRARIMG